MPQAKQITQHHYLQLFEGYCRKNDVDGKEISVMIGKNPLKLKVLSTPENQMKGYMHGEEPKDGEGLLFVYDEELPLSFWMKNVKFPLDLIFFDNSMNYLGHETMDPDDGRNDDDLPRYLSKKPARFAVEVPSGWSNKNIDKDNCKLKF